MKKELKTLSVIICSGYFFITAQTLFAQTSFSKRTVASGFNSALGFHNF